MNLTTLRYSVESGVATVMLDAGESYRTVADFRE